MLLVKADKTTNYYKMEKKEYDKLMGKSIQKTYRKTTEQKIKTINSEARDVATKLHLEDRIEVMARREAFITLKDHKPNFESTLPCRLINPAKSEMGKANKL